MASYLKQFAEGKFLSYSGRDDGRGEDAISFPSVSSDSDQEILHDENRKGSKQSLRSSDHSIFSSTETLQKVYHQGNGVTVTPNATQPPQSRNTNPRTLHTYSNDNDARNRSGILSAHSDRVNIAMDATRYHTSQGDRNVRSMSISSPSASTRSRVAGATERAASPTRSQCAHRAVEHNSSSGQTGGYQSKESEAWQGGGQQQWSTARQSDLQETQHKRSGHATTSDDAHLSGAEAESKMLHMVNEQLMRRVHELETSTRASFETAHTHHKTAEESAAVESTLNKLIHTVSKEREARQLAEAKVAQLTQTLERERREADARDSDLQPMLDTHARASSIATAELKKAHDIIAELRKSVEINAFKMQDAVEANTATASAKVIGRLAASLRAAAPSLSSSAGSSNGSDRALVAEAVCDSVAGVRAALVGVLGPRSAGELTDALGVALVEPMLKALQELSLRGGIKTGEDSDAKAGMDSDTKRKFVQWLAMERERRQKAEKTLHEASEALAHSEQGRVEATKRCLSWAARLDERGGAGNSGEGREECEDECASVRSVRSDMSTLKAGLGVRGRGGRAQYGPYNGESTLSMDPEDRVQRVRRGSHALSHVEDVDGSMFSVSSVEPSSSREGGRGGVALSRAGSNGRGVVAEKARWGQNDLMTPLLFVLMVLLYNQLVGFF